ncbi:MAG TPA: hypothetical protein VGB20_03275 [bacterium]
MTKRRANILELVLVSALALYFELLFIRWLPTQIQVVAYFANLVLLSAFLGLGLGCFAAQSRLDLVPALPVMLLVLVAVGVGFAHVPVAADSQAEHLLGSYESGGLHFLTVLLLVFAFTSLFFAVPGQVMGRLFGAFSPLTAYSLNVAGSLAGLALFWTLSALGTPPVVWFAVGMALCLRFVHRPPVRAVVAALAFLLTLALLGRPDARTAWSPYYKLDVTEFRDRTRGLLGYGIFANQTYHQYALRFDEAAADWDVVRRATPIYAFPYRFVSPDEVLIVGAGSGNDAVFALAAGAKHVDAVEIDPVIAGYGRTLHPHAPYRDPRVRVTVDDARAFLRRTDRRYDLIVFGYLDAHRLLSTFSTVRLDNFIYTRESFEEAKRRLAPGGLLVVTFLEFRDWVAERLARELRQVFGEDLLAFAAGKYGDEPDTVIFLAGPGTRGIPREAAGGFTLVEPWEGPAEPEPATDDWPYLYLRGRGIPGHYWMALAGLLALSGTMLGAAGVRGRHLMGGPLFFLLGSAFMLIETKSITRFALLYGSTWAVNTAVIASILVMILAANALAARLPRRRLEPWFGALALAMLLEWWVPASAYLSLGRAGSIAASCLVLGLPLFFAGVIFARAFRETRDPAGAFGANLTGAVLGGLLEYVSMITGFRALSLVAFGVYGLAFLAWTSSRKLDAGS